MVLVRRRRIPAVTLPPGPFFPGYSPIPAQGQAPWAEKVLVRETPAGGAAAPTVDLRTWGGAGGVLTAQREACARCGTHLAATAKFCSTCVTARS